MVTGYWGVTCSERVLAVGGTDAKSDLFISFQFKVLYRVWLYKIDSQVKLEETHWLLTVAMHGREECNN